MTILILGATGLVGSKCVQHSLSDPRIDSVIAVLRKPIDYKHPKLTQLVVNYDRLNEYADKIKADAVLSALGTTRKQAGSAANFRKVDFDYQYRAAEIVKRNGAKTFVLLSSGGADKTSMALYMKTKGEIEEAVEKLGFDKTAILRPSLLLGDRVGRPVEAVATWVATKLSFVFSGPLEKYKAIEGDTVARAMVNAVQKSYKGVRIVENLEIFEWAKG